MLLHNYICMYVACLTADKTDMRYHIYVRNTCIRMCCVYVRTYKCTYMYPILLLWSVTNRRVCMTVVYCERGSLHCTVTAEWPPLSLHPLVSCFPIPLYVHSLYIFYSPPPPPILCTACTYVCMYICRYTYI